MENLKWLALIPAALGVIFLFFGLLWTAAVQFAVGVALFAIAACVWRLTSGSWDLTKTESE